ncbi:MAG: glycosyltransferase [Candidatus Eremiobacteraeota bacterium]|nr:glycosyltransferase [Candidatus Eremiobacteraeota bacterium]
MHRPLEEKQQLVSVLMPAYNAAPYIERALDSILGQSYRNLEVLVCDDGSDDRTYMILREYRDDRIRLLRNERNLGKVLTFNRLLQASRGSFLAQQDADDYSAPQRLQRQIEFLQGNPHIDLASCDGVVIDENGSVKRPWTAGPLPLDHCETLLSKGCLPNLMPSIVFRKEIIDQVGGYPENFTKLHCYGEDSFWVASMLDQGFRLANLAEPLYFYREASGSLCSPNLHLRFQDYRKLFAGEILGQLFQMKYSQGLDLTLPANNERLESFLAEFQRSQRENPTIFLERFLHRRFQGNARQAALYCLQQLVQGAPDRRLVLMGFLFYCRRWLQAQARRLFPQR